MNADNARILVVDDEPDILKTIKMSLQMEGFKVLEATNGMTALKKTKKERPALIVLDIMLPKMNGFKLCKMIKFDEKYKDIPIIILTAKAQEKDKKLAKKSGAEVFLTKPFESEELIKNINDLLNK